jgi:ribonuclease E
MYQPIVQLKSGGYIVINPTEALVSIDINSGRSTKEHGIEQTALSTNLEAAREIARQLRLRDMAGLVVIDFIDMEHHSNARKVERAMKEALKHDRARIQVGRISSFGLMEMSRQRLRTGVLEASTRECPHCEGTGLVRTASSAALSALRLIEEESAKGNGSQIVLQASQEATIYCLNNKRAELAAIEDRYHVRVLIVPNGETEGAKLAVSSSGPRPERPVDLPPIMDRDEDDIEDAIDDFDDEIEEVEETAREPRRAREERPREEGEGGEGRKRKRRRGRRGGKGRERDGRPEGEDAVAGENEATSERPESNAAVEAPEADAEATPKARRSRRGGRGRDRQEAGLDTAAEASAPTETEVLAVPVEVSEEADTKPKRRSRAKPKAETIAAEAAEKAPAADAPVATDEAPVAKAKAPAKPRAKAKAKDTAPAIAEAATEAPVEAPKAKAPRKKAVAKGATQDVASTDAEGVNEDGTPRTGWWQRTFG